MYVFPVAFVLKPVTPRSNCYFSNTSFIKCFLAFPGSTSMCLFLYLVEKLETPPTHTQLCLSHHSSCVNKMSKAWPRAASLCLTLSLCISSSNLHLLVHVLLLFFGFTLSLFLLSFVPPHTYLMFLFSFCFIYPLKKEDHMLRPSSIFDLFPSLLFIIAQRVSFPPSLFWLHCIFPSPIPFINPKHADLGFSFPFKHGEVSHLIPEGQWLCLSVTRSLINGQERCYSSHSFTVQLKLFLCNVYFWSSERKKNKTHYRLLKIIMFKLR